MDARRLVEMMGATLSEIKSERDAAEEQLKQVKRPHAMCFPKNWNKKMWNCSIWLP